MIIMSIQPTPTFSRATCSRGHVFTDIEQLDFKSLTQLECPTNDALGFCGAVLTIESLTAVRIERIQ